jgi:hypothetical protein
LVRTARLLRQADEHLAQIVGPIFGRDDECDSVHVVGKAIAEGNDKLEACPLGSS